jgi:hypothetical protein
MDTLEFITVGETMIAFEAQEYGPLSKVSTSRKWVLKTIIIDKLDEQL